jgi:ATP-dependent DNA helicase PIF1
MVREQTATLAQRAVLRAARDRDLPLANAQQRALYDAVMADVMAAAAARVPGAPAPPAPPNRAHFVDASGGCGKTFVFNLLLAAVRCEGHVALAVASSGIAALLLDGGTTAHSRFGLPLQPLGDGSDTCLLKAQNEQYELLRAARLILWDEAPMCHRGCFEALDRLLKDIMKSVDPRLAHAPFGGKVIVLAGDFRQVAPVVRRGSRAETVDASLRSSNLWGPLIKHRLSINMRVQRLLRAANDAGAGQPQGGDGEAAAAAAREAQQFADMLLAVGDGAAAYAPEATFGAEMCCNSQDPADLVADIFGDLSGLAVGAADLDAAASAQRRQEVLQRVIHRAILTPRNDDADDINQTVTAQLPGEARIYNSSDHLDESADLQAQQLYSPEFLNALTPQGMPPSQLRLKVGMPVILLRNLNTALGLANGTRLLITAMHNRTLQADILTGPRAGQPVMLCRNLTTTDDPHLPFPFSRRQFPIRPAFAMTINKAQGQTFERIGVYLPRPCFSHGQLYVAISRVGARDAIKLLIASTDQPSPESPQQPVVPQQQAEGPEVPQPQQIPSAVAVQPAVSTTAAPLPQPADGQPAEAQQPPVEQLLQAQRGPASRPSLRTTINVVYPELLTNAA